MLYRVRLSHRKQLSVTLLGVFLAAGSAIGEEERFDRSIITEQLRSYYPELSDSEYDSIQPAPTLFPVLMSIWAKGPFTSESVMGYETPKYTEDASVAFQEPLLVPGTDPSMRSQALLELGESRSPLALSKLVEQLGKETDEKVIADVLRILSSQNVSNLGDTVAPFLKSSSSSVRFYAYTLYAQQKEADVTAALELLKGEEPSLIRHALNVLSARTDRSRLEAWLPFWDSTDLEVKRAALGGMLHYSGVHEYRDAVLALVAEGSIPMKLTIVQNLHSGLDPDFCGEVIQLMAGEEMSVLRAAAATACGKLSLPSLSSILMKLSDDQAVEVRLAAAKGLKAYPTADGFKALVKLSGDPLSLPVREAARDSIVAMAPDYDVKGQLLPALTSENVLTRDSAYQVSRLLKSSQHMDAVAASLSKEEVAANIAHAIRALAVGKGSFAADQILTFADHEAVDVRAAVAEAIGLLHIEAGTRKLDQYALDEHAGSIKAAALLSMGQLADNSFSDTLLEVLKRTNLNSPNATSEVDRTIAAWAFSKLSEPSNTVLKRLRAIITTPVIKTEMGPQFDGDLVRVAACWAIVDLAARTRQAATIQLAQEMIEVLQMDDPDFSQGGGGGMPIPTSDMLRAYGREASQFLAGESITRTPVPLGHYRFSFLSYEK